MYNRYLEKKREGEAQRISGKVTTRTSMSNNFDVSLALKNLPDCFLPCKRQEPFGIAGKIFVEDSEELGGSA